jgi:hypothetical protein
MMFRLKNVPPFSWIWSWWWTHFQCRALGERFVSPLFGPGQVVCSRSRHHLGRHRYNRTELETWPPVEPREVSA